MEHIPISFELKGKQYSGFLDAVSGMGGQTWHVMLGGYYHGSVRIAQERLVYHPNPPAEELGMLAMEDYFIAVITAWYE